MGNCACAGWEEDEQEVTRERAHSMGITPHLFGHDNITLQDTDIHEIEAEIMRREKMPPITMTCKLLDTHEQRQVTVKGYEAIRPSLCRELAALAVSEIHCGPLTVDEPNDTRWEELEVDGDTVVVAVGVKSTAAALVPAMAKVNAHLFARDFEERITRDPDEPTVLKEVDFCALGITELPELFGLKVSGNLRLHGNKLTSLPESMGSIQVGGYLSLAANELTSLPESMGSLQVGGDLALHNNRLVSLPESMRSIRVGGDLHLKGNRLQRELAQADFPNVEGTVSQ